MSEEKFLIIDSRPYGLFSIFLHTIDNIKWAEDNGYIPVVRWGPGRVDVNKNRPGAEEASFKGHPSYCKQSTNFVPSHTDQSEFKECLYWDNDGWNGSKNPWEYCFEPLNQYTIEEALTSEHMVSDIFQIGKLDFELDNKFLISNIHSYIPLKLWTLKSDKSSVHRAEVNEIVEKINIKNNILNKVNLFAKKYFVDNMLGIHIRGTDKKTEQRILKCISIDRYIKKAEECIKKYNISNIYIASDTNEAIYKFVKYFGKEKIIAYTCNRMQKYESSVCLPLSSIAGPKIGEEALIEALLLSQCNHFISSDSNMSSFPIYKNLDLTYDFISPHGDRNV